MNRRLILYILGWVLNCEAVCMLLPLLCAALYHEPVTVVFLECIAICAVIGALLTLKPPKNKTMYAKEGLVIVAMSWIVISIFGALPFVLSGVTRSFVDALFETMSGFTTTGASIFRDIDFFPRALIFWRSFTHWIGGMGVLVFLVAMLPLSGGNNLFLMKAESPGPAVTKLVPKVRSTAKILYGIYVLLTLIEVVLLLLGGMTLFEALTLSFGTAGTGGFAITNAGIGEYSAYSQVVITIFMIIFGVDFSFYYLLLIRKFKSALQMEEIRAYLGIIFLSIVAITINCRGIFTGFFETLRHAAFQVGSIITTTGYSTCDFNRWPEFSKTILIILMFVGACAGSTGGGTKVSRIMILAKSIIKEAKIAVHPKSTHKIKMNGRIIEHETVRSINVFYAAYFMIFIVSLLIISFDNFDFTTNFTAIAATINNIGPGMAKVGPTANFSIYSPLSKLVMTFDMLVGRLEIFPVMVLLSPYTWKK